MRGRSSTVTPCGAIHATSTDLLSAAHYAEIGRVLERGQFDLLIVADRLAVADRFGSEKDTGLRLGDQDAFATRSVAGALGHLGLHSAYRVGRDLLYDL